jgi:hypothetical protein
MYVNHFMGILKRLNIVSCVCPLFSDAVSYSETISVAYWSEFLATDP